MNKIRNKITQALIVLFVASTILIGCKKNEVKSEEIAETKLQVKDNDKLLNFVAWSLQVPKENIKFDKNTNEFYIPNTVVREKLERIESEYAKANIYKLNFEQK